MLNSFKLLRIVKRNSIINCDFLNFTIPVRGSQCFCLSWTSINPATPLNKPCKSVNINTHKTLSMQQQLHFATDQLLQIYRAKWLPYIPSAATLMQSALSIPTVPYVLYWQHNATAELCKQLYVLSGG